MSEPLTPERLAEIREEMVTPFPTATHYAEAAFGWTTELLNEVERLRAENEWGSAINKALMDSQENAVKERNKLRDWQKRAVSHLLHWQSHGWLKSLEAESVDKLITEAEAL